MTLWESWGLFDLDKQTSRDFNDFFFFLLESMGMACYYYFLIMLRSHFYFVCMEVEKKRIKCREREEPSLCRWYVICLFIYLFCIGKIDGLLTVKMTLFIFEKASRLKINFYKGMNFCINLVDDKISSVKLYIALVTIYLSWPTTLW